MWFVCVVCDVVWCVVFFVFDVVHVFGFMCLCVFVCDVPRDVAWALFVGLRCVCVN